MTMPTSDQAALRALDQRARLLQTEIAAARPRTEVEPHEVSDWKDSAMESALAEIADAEVERDIAELRDIGHARQRLEAGCYGVCQDCGKAIGDARLLAQPAAIRCVDCQALAESHGQPAVHR